MLVFLSLTSDTGEIMPGPELCEETPLKEHKYFKDLEYLKDPWTLCQGGSVLALINSELSVQSEMQEIYAADLG